MPSAGAPGPVAGGFAAAAARPGGLVGSPNPGLYQPALLKMGRIK